MLDFGQQEKKLSKLVSDNPNHVPQYVCASLFVGSAPVRGGTDINKL